MIVDTYIEWDLPFGNQTWLDGTSTLYAMGTSSTYVHVLFPASRVGLGEGMNISQFGIINAGTAC